MSNIVRAKRGGMVRFKCPQCDEVTSDWYAFDPDSTWAPWHSCGTKMVYNPDDIEEVSVGEWNP